MNDEVFIGVDSAEGILTVLGNEHYLDGRTFEIHRNDCSAECAIALVGEPNYNESIATFPTYEAAVVVYNLAGNVSTLEEARTIIRQNGIVEED